MHFDYKLYPHDIAGSVAHAKMLGKQGLVSPEEAEAMVEGLLAIKAEIEAGTFEWDPALEDVHMNIERNLARRIGPAGEKLHTARSRNDQVALDTRLYLREAIDLIREQLKALRLALVRKAEDNLGLILPGYTHLQRAQPILVSHHLMAYQEMLKRDGRRLDDLYRRVNVMPLGSAALAGTGLPIDMEFVARELGFDRVTGNSMDAVADRDHLIEFAGAASIIMMHLSRLSEDLILWATSEFDFVDLPDEMCTGSSIMPQKKNPDALELIRGKTGRIYGHLMGLLTVMKGLPMAYKPGFAGRQGTVVRYGGNHHRDPAPGGPAGRPAGLQVEKHEGGGRRSLYHRHRPGRSPGQAGGAFSPGPCPGGQDRAPLPGTRSGPVRSDDGRPEPALPRVGSEGQG